MEQRASGQQRLTPLEALPIEVGKRIRAARQERGMSLAQVGGRDLSRSFLSSVENGRSRISLRALSIVASRLQLPLGYFLDSTQASAEVQAELTLNEAEAALSSQHPEKAEALLADVEVPTAMRARALWLRAWMLIDLGRYREAVPSLEEGLVLAEKAEDVRQRTLIQFTLATALSAAGEPERALVNLNRALDGVTQEPVDTALQGRIAVAIGNMYYNRHDYDAALEQFAQARELFRGLNDLDNLANVYTGLSAIYRDKGDLDNAVRYSRLGVGVYKVKEDRRQAARQLNSMAGHCRDLGRIDLALDYAGEAIQWARQSGARDIEALAHSTLATIYLQQGDSEAALKEAEAAEQTASGEVDRGRIDAWVVLAQLAQGAGDVARVDVLYSRALEGLGQIGDLHRYREAALLYSDALQSRGDLEGALKYAREAAKAG